MAQADGAIRLAERPRSRLEDDPATVQAFYADRNRTPKRTIAVSIGMSVCGIILLCLGGSWWTTEKSRATAFFVLGSILVLPGFYSSYLLYMAWKRKQGYYFGDVPSYDEPLFG
eukprot:tig00020553_g10563.t1